MSEALVPAPSDGRVVIERPGSSAVALPAVIVAAGPAAVERFLEFFAAAIANGRTRAALRAGGGAVSGLVRRAGPRVACDRAAPRRRLHPDARRAAGPGAAERDGVQFRAGERGDGDAAAGLLPAGCAGLAAAAREGREAARRAGAPPRRPQRSIRRPIRRQIAETARPCRLRGVPTPFWLRSSSPMLQAAAWSSTRLRTLSRLAGQGSGLSHPLELISQLQR